METSVVRCARHAGVALALSLLSATTLAQQPAPQPSASPAPPVSAEVASHDLGLIFGNQLRASGLESKLSLDALMRGTKEGMEGKPLTPEVKEHVNAFLHAAREALAGQNKRVAQEFLAKNAKAEGVKTTASGLQYKVIAAGDGSAKSPGLNDQVTVQYRGTLLDGSEFDSSFGRGPASFPLKGVIRGWQEAIPLMKPGAKWQLFVPPELAYDTYSPPGIPPGSLLVFDVELIKVEPVSASAPQATGEPAKKSAPAAEGSPSS
jgi:FKBP-type peptidyl-prolyl cis-trans isomerase FklB